MQGMCGKCATIQEFSEDCSNRSGDWKCPGVPVHFSFEEKAKLQSKWLEDWKTRKVSPFKED